VPGQQTARSPGAWNVSLALAPDPSLQCKAALNARASYGESLQPYVESVLERGRTLASNGRGSSCR
jgi:hypothetical protein